MSDGLRQVLATGAPGGSCAAVTLAVDWFTTPQLVAADVVLWKSIGYDEASEKHETRFLSRLRRDLRFPDPLASQVDPATVIQEID